MTDTSNNQKNIYGNEPVIFTSLEYATIESGLVIYKNYHDTTIFPIGNISKNTNIKDKKNLDILKKKFGSTDNDEISEKYWNEKKVYSQFPLLKGNVPKINWKYTNKYNLGSMKNIDVQTSELNSYSFKNFLKFINNILFFDKSIKDKNIVFICDSKLILDILKNVSKKNTKYNERTDIIEYSSIWDIKLSLNFTKKQINFDYFNKIYPTEYNHSKSVKYEEDNKFSYMFEGHKFILYNSLKLIPSKYIKIHNFRCLSDKKHNINLILGNKEKENTKSDNSNRNSRNKVIKNNIYEDIMEHINREKN